MNRSTRALFIASIFFNVIFAAAFFSDYIATKNFANRNAIPDLPTEKAHPHQNERKTTVSDGAAILASTFAAKEKNAPSLSELQSIVNALRDAKCPANLVRAIVTGLVNEQFLERRLAVLYPASEPYWRQGPQSSSQKRIGALKLLSTEQQKVIFSLIGEDINAENSEQERVRVSRYGNIAAEKINRLEEINQNYAEIKSRLDEPRDAPVSAEERKRQLRQLDIERRSDLGKILTTAEVAEYDLHQSASATRVQSALRNIDIVETEYQRIFMAQRIFDEKNADDFRLTTAAIFDERNSGLLAHHEAIHEILGDSRYYNYLKNVDTPFAQISAITDRFGLPTQAAVDVSALRRNTQNEVMRLVQDAALNPQTRIATMRQTLQSAESKVGIILGPAALKEYKTQGGQWLRTPTVPQFVVPQGK